MKKFNLTPSDHKDENQENIFFDALRGIAAILVYISHADANRFFWYEPILPIKGALGELGVNLFFILSGHLIWNSAQKNFQSEGGLKIYAINRATRILPLYFISILFCIIVLPTLTTGFLPTITVENIFRHITFTQGLLPLANRAFNPVLWSLTHEIIFYILVPLIFLAKRKYLVVLLGTIVCIIASQKWQNITIQPFLDKFILFCFGIFLVKLKEYISISLSIAVFLILLVVELPISLKNHLFAISIFILLFSLKDSKEPILRIAIRILSPFGVISYSIYIWHYPLIEIAPRIINQFNALNESMLLRGISFAILCGIICTISYLIIEKPMMTTFRKWLLKKYTA